MVARIDKLTKEQSDAMSAWADRWIEIGLRTGPADRAKFEAAAAKCYAAASLKWHGRVVWVQSPLIVALAGPIADHIISSRCGAVDGAVGGAVDGAVRGAVRGAVGGKWHRYIGGQFWVGGYYWGPAFVSFFRECCGLSLPGDLWERSKAYEESVESACWWWPHKDFIIVSERPLAIHREQIGPPGPGSHRLHCESGPAIYWPDGWGVYSWHGVTVPSHWIEHRETLDPNEVIRAANVEQRAAGAAIVGWPKMLDVLEARVIDDSGSEDIGQLIELTLPGLDEPGRFLKARCPRNGLIVEGVPRISDVDLLPIETAIAAQAWRIGDPQSDYTHPPRRT